MNVSRVSSKRLWPSDSIKSGERQERETLSNRFRHIIKWMLRDGLRTGLITSTGLSRDVNNSVFVAGLKPIRGLIWSLKSEHWARARHHRDKNITVTTSRWSNQWSKSQDLRFPQPSTYNLGSKKRVNTEKTKKSTTETWKKSTCQDLRRGECDEWPYCDPGASLAVLSDLKSGVKTRQTSPATSIVRAWDVRKQLSSAREDDDPSNSEKNLSHPLQSSSPAGQLSSLRAATV